MVVPYLWGIETIINNNFLYSIPTVVPYLWGIETIGNPFFSLRRSLACCTLPMRNWNLLIWLLRTSWFFTMLLYLTYEELKQYIVDFVETVRKLCCTLPMRNWNFLRPNIAPTGIQKLYLTYEELKQIHFHYFHYRFSPVVPYLWGIETINFIILICHGISVVPYLWGIETSTVIH